MQTLKQCKYQCLLLINVLAVSLLGPCFNCCHLRRLWLWVPSTAESSGAEWRGQNQPSPVQQASMRNDAVVQCDMDGLAFKGLSDIVFCCLGLGGRESWL